jgi:hypothetical protein
LETDLGDAEEMGPEETYVRLQVTYRGRLGVEVGIFVAVDHLRRAGLLSVEEEEVYFDIDDWFRVALPNPPFYADGNSIGAVTWFKKSRARDLLERLRPLQRILERHGVEHVVTESTDPGRVVYEDEFQVGVIPYERKNSTPMPDGLVLGPTTPGCKRHMAKQARLNPDVI